MRSHLLISHLEEEFIESENGTIYVIMYAFVPFSRWSRWHTVRAGIRHDAFGALSLSWARRYQGSTKPLVIFVWLGCNRSTWKHMHISRFQLKLVFVYILQICFNCNLKIQFLKFYLWFKKKKSHFHFLFTKNIESLRDFQFLSWLVSHPSKKTYLPFLFILSFSFWLIRIYINYYIVI